MRLKLCGAAIAVVLVVAGCGSDSGSSTSASSATSEQTTPARQTTIVHYVNKYPRPRNPGPHPSARVDQLLVRDVRKGPGPEIHAGDSGIFEFIATNWVTGAPLEAAWHRRRPFETQIEKGVVIDGWWQGIPGMRVGGRRQITIPPSLGFTQNPTLTGATTYFDVVLNQVNPQQPAGLGGRGPAEGTPTPTG
jgi:peptidylprolyl isomerase